MNKTVGVISLGCNKNRVDTETALGILKDCGYSFTTLPEKADILLVNTCGFIESAKEESIDTIFEMAEYKKTGRCRLLAVSGCLVQRYGKELKEEIPEVDLWLGVNQYHLLPAAIEKAFLQKGYCFLDDDLSYFEQHRVLTTPSYSAYTRIGEGCSNRCTFCAIPLIRGPYRSRDEKKILDEIRVLSSEGVREHILVAQDTTRYGTDTGGHTTLPSLMKKVSEIPGVDWPRVLYCYPDETNDELLDLIANTPNICSYLDIPVQHINSELLKRMHRRGTREDIIRNVMGAKQRNITVRTSIIVGFPGETDDQFKELLDFVQEAQFDTLGAFKYSPEENTPACKLPDQIPEEIKEDRYQKLMELQSRISLENNRKRLNTIEKVLVTDYNKEGYFLGRSEKEAPETDGEIIFTSRDFHPEKGSFVNVRINRAETYDLFGETVSSMEVRS